MQAHIIPRPSSSPAPFSIYPRPCRLLSALQNERQISQLPPHFPLESESQSSLRASTLPFFSPQTIRLNYHTIITRTRRRALSSARRHTPRAIIHSLRMQPQLICRYRDNDHKLRIPAPAESIKSCVADNATRACVYVLY